MIKVCFHMVQGESYNNRPFPSFPQSLFQSECKACTRGCYKPINIDFKRGDTPFVLSISQRSIEGRIDPPAQPDQIHVGPNTATLSQAGTAVPAWLRQAVPAWLRPLSNIISHTLFQLSMNRVLWNRLRIKTDLHGKDFALALALK